MTEEKTQEQIALDLYNSRFNNDTYMEARSALEDDLSGHPPGYIMNAITDVALHLSGHPNYTPDTWHTFVILSTGMTAKQIHLALAHLREFDPASYIPF